MEGKLKKIGILAFVNKNAGGVYQYTQSLIDALAKDETNQYIVFVDSNSGNIQSYNLEVRKVNTSRPNAIVRVLKAIQLLLLLKTSFLEKVERSKYEDIDLFICPRVIMYTQFFAIKPFILTLHDLQEYYYPEFFSFLERIVRFVTTRFLSQKAEKIICESNYVKNDIKKFLKIPEEKIVVLPAPPPANFMNIQISIEQKLKVKRKYNLPDNYVFYPAAFWQHKNHIKLLEAFKILAKVHPDLYLVLSGSKQKSFSVVENKVSEFGLKDKVLFLGYIDYEDMPYLYVSSKMLVMPSLFESISIPIFEAFALRVPVCASNILALPEQVGNAGLLFDPNNEKDIANKINFLLEDINLKYNLGMEGYYKIQKYSHKDHLVKLLKLIDSILISYNLLI